MFCKPYCGMKNEIKNIKNQHCYVFYLKYYHVYSGLMFELSFEGPMVTMATLEYKKKQMKTKPHCLSNTVMFLFVFYLKYYHVYSGLKFELTFERPDT